MSKEIDKPTILIVGTYNESDAYPNVKYKLEGLRNDESIDCIEKNCGAQSRISYDSSISRYVSILRVFIATPVKLLRCLWHIVTHKDADALYIPYPATFILYALSFLPALLKPSRIVVDTFISLYDTVVLDRQLVHSRSIPAKILHRVESRALSQADACITDTDESSAHISNLLGLDRTRFIPIPLSTNETVFKPKPKAHDSDSPFSVIFVGTLVPLHGIDTILEAFESIEITQPDVCMCMTFVGDGQEREKLKSFLLNRNTKGSIQYRWVNTWQSSAQLYQLISEADLCIGIMKQTGKSGRVWPLKNYLYMASESALITAKTPVSERLSDDRQPAPFISINTKNARELADKLVHYSNNPSRLPAIAQSGRTLYDDKLSNLFAYSQLRRCLLSS